MSEEKKDEIKIETQIECFRAELKSFVSWKIFVWVMGIFGLVIGWQFYILASLNSQITTNSTEGFKIQTQLSQIQTDLQWIKQAINENK